MCGRFTLSTSADDLASFFRLGQLDPIRPRYNVAPTQDVATVRVLLQGKRRELHWLHWGLIPSWARDPAMGSRLINARSETVADKPSFRAAFKRRRCLVLADGFYEWKQLASKQKQPYLIRMRDGSPFGIAGLWERWKDPDGQVVESCTLLTTRPNELLAPIHDRMPVILHPDDHDTWLDPDNHDSRSLEALLKPCPADVLEAFAVTTRVNSPRQDDPTCIEPL